MPRILHLRTSGGEGSHTRSGSFTSSEKDRTAIWIERAGGRVGPDAVFILYSQTLKYQKDYLGIPRGVFVQYDGCSSVTWTILTQLTG